MTDNEIIKALEICENYKETCEYCPYDNIRHCADEIRKDTLNLIKRQRAEIERLKTENERVKTNIYKMAIDKALAEKARAEAIKEFADKLKAQVLDFVDCNNEAIEDHIQTSEQPNVEFVEYVRGKVMGLYGFREQIDNLVKEMGCGE